MQNICMNWLQHNHLLIFVGSLVLASVHNFFCMTVWAKIISTRFGTFHCITTCKTINPTHNYTIVSVLPLLYIFIHTIFYMYYTWSTLQVHNQQFYDFLLYKILLYCKWKVNFLLHSQKKGTKAVTGAVPFQKVNFCTFQVLIFTFQVLMCTFQVLMCTF